MDISKLNKDHKSWDLDHGKNAYLCGDCYCEMGSKESQEECSYWAKLRKHCWKDKHQYDLHYWHSETTGDYGWDWRCKFCGGNATKEDDEEILPLITQKLLSGTKFIAEIQSEPYRDCIKKELKDAQEILEAMRNVYVEVVTV